jgi:hypothetical protein
VVVILLVAAVVAPTPPALAWALALLSIALPALAAVRSRHHP